ncbi:hypothetical protein [Paractinoplanes hotanensis]|uniref:Uncharacterized protein n=1 Tax=Paractinoplanes hotanensis TaxID=2906497 RepID=A0ABT0YGY9_9ACTN|nr:hypothetical protein [Actinoplanes hotanensis]MCM4085020.1 hypothetical protein [Actinoplanes hotanensis]
MSCTELEFDVPAVQGKPRCLTRTSDHGLRRRRANRLFAEALFPGPWTGSAEAIARVDPEIVVAIDRQLSRELGECVWAVRLVGIPVWAASGLDR